MAIFEREGVEADMKKLFILLAILSVLAIPGAVLASDITDALYYGVITVSNNGTATENVSTTMTLDSQSLIDVYDIDTAFDYVAIRNSAGTDVPFMPSVNANPWCLWVPSIVEDGNLNYLFYTGQTSLNATKYYFPGATGMSVSDNADLEPGSDYKFELGDIYVNTDTDDSYPTVESSANSSVNIVGTSHAVSMPSGIVAGSLLIVYVSTYSSVGVAQANISNWGAGWTSLGLTDSNTNPDYCIGVAYKVAAGGDTMTFTTAGNSFSSHQSYRISNYQGTPEISSAAAWSGATATPDPPSLTTSWGNLNATLWFAMCGGATAATRTMSSYPSNYSDGALKTNTGAIVTHCGVARRELIAYSQDPGVFTLSDTLLKTSAFTVSIKGQDIGLLSKRGAVWIYADSGGISATESGGTSLSAASIASGEHKVEVYSDGANWKLEVDDVLEDTDAIGSGIPNTAYNWQIGSGATPYLEYAKIYVGGTLQGSWEWEYGITFTDISGNSHTATPSFRTASSDTDVTASLVSFQPINTAIPPAFTVEDPADFITGNVTTTGQFTTGNISSTGGPPGFALVSDLATQGNTPNIWAFGIIALCMVSAGQLFWIWMQRRYGFRSMWPMFATGLLVMGLFVALGGTVKVFDFWMIVFYIVIFICLMVMSRHTEVGGNVSTHGMIGFAAQSWIGLTLINKMLEGAFIGASETAWVNTYAFTQEFKLFNIFSLPVLNLDFWTKGIPSLLRWDYSFFGGNAQLFQYLLYSLTAVIAFIIFGLLIGLLYNFFRGR